jgi:lipid kinase YegS
MGSKRTARLVLNARAAGDDALRAAMAGARRLGHRVEGRAIREPGDAERFAEEAAREGTGAVIAAGGDGTVNAVLNGLARAGFPDGTALGLIPFGTANDFAASCGLEPDDPAAALKVALEAEPTRLDAGKVGDRLFLNVASLGHAAEVTTGTPGPLKDAVGGFAYLLTGVANVVGVEPRRLRLSGDGFEWQGEALGVFVGNGRQAGGGFRVTPRARADDGRLDVMVLPAVSWTELPGLAADFLKLGPDAVPESIAYARVRWLEVESEGDTQANLDGEPIRGDRFRFEALPARVSVLIPADAPLLRSPE